MKLIKIILIMMISFNLFSEPMKKIKIYQVKETKKEEIVETYLIKNLNSKEVLEALDDTYNVKLKLIGNELILKGSRENIEKIKKLLLNIDKKKRQVLIKATIIETSDNLFERIGLNWKIAGKDISQGVSLTKLFNLPTDVLGVDIEALKENQDLKIKTVPELLVLDQEEGLLKIINEMVLQTNAKTKPFVYEAGIIFKIRPKIITKGFKEFVNLNISAELSNFSLSMKNKNGKVKNSFESVISVENNKSIYIGGLRQQSNKKSVNKTPILGDIPIFDTFFKKRNKNVEKRNIYLEIEVNILDE